MLSLSKFDGGHSTQLWEIGASKTALLETVAWKLVELSIPLPPSASRNWPITLQFDIRWGEVSEFPIFKSL